jgi:formyltetrahydrofolate deformylase
MTHWCGSSPSRGIRRVSSRCPEQKIEEVDVTQHPQSPSDGSDWIVTIACTSHRGQIAAVCQVLDAHGAYLRSVATHDDARTGRFFVRIECRVPTPDAEGAAGLRREVHAQLQALADAYGPAEVGVHDAAHRARVLLMVSKMDHCLVGLLDGWHSGELPMQPVAIVSNHRDAEALARAEGMAFHHLPVTPDTKAAREAELRAIVADTEAEFVVLARYMQVLSDDFAGPLHGRVINIHHSFLPSFKGARPYEQAWERGVKLIGATAHFVTADLDEGPIIEQAVEPVTHADEPERLVQRGRHVESRVLRQALRHVLERRVFLNGTRTIVLH